MNEIHAAPSPEVMWPYSVRNSVDVGRYVDELLAPPQRPLSESQLQDVRGFCFELCQGNTINGIACEAERDLEALLAASVLKDVQTFDLDYFRTPSGGNDLLVLGLQENSSDDELKERLYDIKAIDTILGAKGRKELATRASNWRRDMIAERLVDEPEHDAEYAPENTVTVAYKPEELLDKLGDLRAHRMYLRQIRNNLKSEGQTNTRDAKIVTTEILLARANGMTAGLYPAAVALAKQLDATVSNESAGLVERLCDVAPFLLRAFKDEEAFDQAHTSKFLEYWKEKGLRRIDYVSNGIGYSNEGKISPLDANLVSWAEGYDPTEAGAVMGQVFSEEELAVMDRTIWGAEQTMQFGEAIVREWDLLSTHRSTWEEVDERSGPAPDAKWQFIITPHKKTLSVNGPKKVVFVPEKMERTLTQVSEAGIVPLLAHESAHVLQNEFDSQLAEQVPAAAIKGRRNVTIRELGGVMEETEVQAAFGRLRPTTLHYLRALQAKERGDNPLQVARAFFESLCPDSGSLTESQYTKLRKQAADRSRRFYRAGGHSTQPLDYVEQGYIGQVVSSLPPVERKALAIAGGSFTLNDAAALHAFGLLELPQHIDKDPAQTAIQVFRRDFLPRLMAA
jgi:hypothetical protein